MTTSKNAITLVSFLIRSWWCGMKTFNPYPLRIDEELMEELKEMAEVHSRSVNKEIEFLIKEAVKKYKSEKDDENKTRKKTS